MIDVLLRPGMKVVAPTRSINTDARFAIRNYANTSFTIKPNKGLGWYPFNIITEEIYGD